MNYLRIVSLVALGVCVLAVVGYLAAVFLASDSLLEQLAFPLFCIAILSGLCTAIGLTVWGLVKQPWRSNSK